MVELEILKTHIKINQVNKSIRPSILSAYTPIFFDQKLDRFFYLYVNYNDLNNLIIKNQYPLPLVQKSLDKLKRGRQFTQLKLTSAYYWMKICKGNKQKIAFYIWYSHFKYQVIFFTLTNVLANFQKYINKIFINIFNIIVIVYLDNILIYIYNNRNSNIAAVL